MHNALVLQYTYLLLIITDHIYIYFSYKEQKYVIVYITIVYLSIYL